MSRKPKIEDNELAKQYVDKVHFGKMKQQDLATELHYEVTAFSRRLKSPKVKELILQFIAKKTDQAAQKEIAIELEQIKINRAGMFAASKLIEQYLNRRTKKGDPAPDYDMVLDVALRTRPLMQSETDAKKFIAMFIDARKQLIVTIENVPADVRGQIEEDALLYIMQVIGRLYPNIDWSIVRDEIIKTKGGRQLENGTESRPI